jgi:hypothetical protein
MARPEWRDRGKERFWRRVVRRWQRSGLGVRAFCAVETVSEPSFYGWRRELARRDQQAAANVAPRFVPVHVRSDIDVAPTVTDITTASPPAIDVVLANGRRLCVPAGFDPAMLRQLLAVVEETPAC